MVPLLLTLTSGGPLSCLAPSMGSPGNGLKGARAEGKGDNSQAVLVVWFISLRGDRDSPKETRGWPPPPHKWWLSVAKKQKKKTEQDTTSYIPDKQQIFFFFFF